MDNPINLTEKYERNGWPSIKRPDRKPPDGWNLSLITSLERISSHALSRDGEVIACIKDGESLSDVYLMPSIGGWLTRITTDRSLAPYWDDEIPAWSADGKWIAFIAQETEHEELYLIQPNGEGLHQLTNTGYDVVQFEWSPRGRQLAVICNRNGAFDLSLVETETGSIVDLRTGTGIHSNPNWAQDETFITYEYESPLLPPDLYRLDVASKRVKQLTYSNPPALQKNKKVIPELICYKSYDGLEIPAFLYKPEKSNGAAIVYPHGDPQDHYGLIWDELAQYFAAKGYTYLAPNYRGLTGYGKQYERANYENWGIGDTQDCLHAAKFLRGFQEIRPESVGSAGGSYGGYIRRK